MKPTKEREATIKGRAFSVKWDMPALFLFAEYAKCKTVEECERLINAALLEINKASDDKLKGMPIESVKTVVKMVRAALNDAVSEKELTTLLGEGELDDALKQTIEAYVDNLPDYEAGVTQDAPKAVKKKRFRLGVYLKWLRRWVGSLKIFGRPLWGSSSTPDEGTT